MYRKKIKPTSTNVFFIMVKIGNSTLNPTLELKSTKLKSATYSPKQPEKYDDEK